MATLSVTQQILTQLERLTPEQQQQVLDFAQGLARPVGESGDELIRSAQGLDFSPEDLAEMAQAIEEDCENINPDAW